MKVVKKPFRHVKTFDFLSEEEYIGLCNCTQSLKWELYDRGGYKYSVCGLDYENECYLVNKDAIYKLISSEFISSLSNLLKIGITKVKDFTYHKMEVGDFSNKHTDQNDYQEIARVIYYLSEPDTYKGGDLITYGKGGFNIHETLRMPINSFFAFKLIDEFFHEVTIIEEGVRYCIVITYY